MANSNVIEVTAAIIHHRGKILLARRGPSKHLAGYWEFPGGKIEEGEQPESCLEREILEELGVRIKVCRFFMANQHQYEIRTILLKSYLCELTDATEFRLVDHDQLEWVERHRLNNYKIAPADIPIIKSLQDMSTLKT